MAKDKSLEDKVDYIDRRQTRDIESLKHWAIKATFNFVGVICILIVGLLGWSAKAFMETQILVPQVQKKSEQNAKSITAQWDVRMGDLAGQTQMMVDIAFMKGIREGEKSCKQ